MKTHEIYRRYLVATRLTRIADEVGITIGSFDFHMLDRWWHTSEEYGQTYQGYAADVQPRIDLWSKKPEEREEIAVALLDRLPGAILSRKNGSIGILVYLNDLRVEIAIGEGVCERVQVGTRTIPAEPEREEPIYEVRCPDPITAIQ